MSIILIGGCNYILVLKVKTRFCLPILATWIKICEIATGVLYFIEKFEMLVYFLEKNTYHALTTGMACHNFVMYATIHEIIHPEMYVN